MSTHVSFFGGEKRKKYFFIFFFLVEQIAKYRALTDDN